MIYALDVVRKTTDWPRSFLSSFLASNVLPRPSSSVKCELKSPLESTSQPRKLREKKVHRKWTILMAQYVGDVCVVPLVSAADHRLPALLKHGFALEPTSIRRESTLCILILCFGWFLSNCLQGLLKLLGIRQPVSSLCSTRCLLFVRAGRATTS